MNKQYRLAVSFIIAKKSEKKVNGLTLKIEEINLDCLSICVK